MPVQHMKLLAFDKMTVDTSLAKDYLQKYKVFLPLGIEAEETDIVHDSYGSKITSVECGIRMMKSEKIFHQDQMKPCLQNVAKKVKENSDLFAQLEYLIRKTNVEDVKTFDVMLIAKRFEYYSSLSLKSSFESLLFPVRIPSRCCLATLGVVAQYLHEGRSVRLVCAPDTAVLGHLFTELCYEAGFTTDHIRYCTITDHLINNHYSNGIVECHYLPGMVAGAVAVLTEQGDAESAASCLAGATVNPIYPWRLRRVLVQEAALAGLRRALARRAGAPPAPGRYCLPRSTFLLDPAADEPRLPPHLVLVSTYRTTKELLALLDEYRPIYLSLWCNDSSTRDEIAFATSAQNVWVNDYGAFEGPAEVGRSFFLGFDQARERNRMLYLAGEPPGRVDPTDEDVKLILQLKAGWDKLDLEQRRAAMLAALDRHEPGPAANDIEEHGRLREVLSDWEPESFAKVDKHTLCVGTTEKGCVVSFDTSFTYRVAINAFKSVLSGNVIIIPYANDAICKDLLGHFHDSGVPVVVSSSLAGVADYEIGTYYYRNGDRLIRKKFIWSKFGETYAN